MSSQYNLIEAELDGAELIESYKADWNLFAEQVLGASLDTEQKAILSSVQHNPRTSVSSGTARGKDFVAAVAAICFLYLTPVWDDDGSELIENTKVALSAPTDRQVKNIMMPEISRLYNRAKQNVWDGLPGRLNAYDIRTEHDEWFLTGFKADSNNHEAWSGFHAVNTMFVITEASGISDDTFNAIEGNLQGNSRILIVFNPNTIVGYAAKSQKSERWSRFRLNSLTAPNVIEKKTVIPGQVDYEWVVDKVKEWCTPILKSEIQEEQDDFEFEGEWYRPDDLFRVKVLGLFPKVSEDSLIPQQWIVLANERWAKKEKQSGQRILGVDVAGMGRDSSAMCYREGDYVHYINKHNSGGVADHMKVTGTIANFLTTFKDGYASIDTIGEGAGVYSRLNEQGYNDRAISCKYSEAAKRGSRELTDVTGQHKFANMRAYLFWAVRDWLNPKNNTGAALPPSDAFMEEATEIRWLFQSNGKIIIEPKDDIKKRLGRSTDEFDALANTFYPLRNTTIQNIDKLKDHLF